MSCEFVVFQKTTLKACFPKRPRVEPQQACFVDRYACENSVANLRTPIGGEAAANFCPWVRSIAQIGMVANAARQEQTNNEQTSNKVATICTN
jgi:hypothetical protein